MTQRLNKKKDISPIRTHTPLTNRNRSKNYCITNTNTTVQHTNSSNISHLKTQTHNYQNYYGGKSSTNLTTGYGSSNNYNSNRNKNQMIKRHNEVQAGLKKLSKANILNNLTNLQKKSNVKNTRLGSNNHYRSSSTLYKGEN